MKKLYTFLWAIVVGFSFSTSSAQISTYCASNATSSGDSKIDSVGLNTIAQVSSPTACETYTDNTSISTVLAPGATYSIGIKNGTCGGSYTNYKGAWIDFNQNGLFDASEQILTATTSFPHAGTVNTASFTVPSTAVPGTTYLRAVSAEVFGGATACGTYTWGETEDYTIIIVSNTTDDAGVAAILEPIVGCAGDREVIARISNFGINQITSVEVHWTFNGQSQTTLLYGQSLDTLNGSGPSNANVSLGTVSLIGGTNASIKAWTESPNNTSDGAPINDTALKVLAVSPSVDSFPYYQDFEAGTGDWVMGGSNSTWAYGTPGGTNISGAASGVKAFVTSLTGSYSSNEASQVSSPCFDLSDFEGDAWVALDVNWYSESNYDGAVLQYSTDGGNSWQNVGAAGDPFNWFNESGLFGSPGGQGDGWAGGYFSGSASGGWVKAKHMLVPAALVKDVKFRIAFGSDSSVESEGFAFDNFTIVDFKEADFGGDLLSLCAGVSVELDPNVNFNGDIEWSTGDTINETITVFGLDTVWVIYTDTMLDLSTSDTVVIVQSTPPAINFSTLRDTIALNGQTTLDPKTSFELDYDWQPGGYDFPYLLVKGADLGVGTHVYTLTVTDSLQCQDMRIVRVVVVDFTGIEGYESAAMSFYPNPVNDILTIKLDGFDNGAVTLQILDLQGRTVMSKSLDHVDNRAYRIDVGDMPSGVYMLSVQSETKTALAKIIVN